MKSDENIFQPATTLLNVGVLVMDACNTLSLAAVLDPMRAANRRAGKPLFSWTILTPETASVQLTTGLPVTGIALRDAPGFDALFVIAGFALEEQSTHAFLSSLRWQAGRSLVVGGVDGGSWILARAGLLDGHRATTHWEDTERFAIRFPAVEAMRDRYVISGRFVTTGGASPTLDMMLHLIRSRHGETLAMRVASAFIYEPVHTGDTPQSLIAPARVQVRAPKVAQAIRIMEDSLDDPPGISQIARRVGMTPRHMENRFRAALGTTPGAFFLTLRLSEALRLATDTAQPVQGIALATGFNSQAAFARAFKKAHGLSVTELRRRSGHLF